MRDREQVKSAVANLESLLPNPAYQPPFLITVSAMLFGASA